MVYRYVKSYVNGIGAVEASPWPPTKTGGEFSPWSGLIDFSILVPPED